MYALTGFKKLFVYILKYIYLYIFLNVSIYSFKHLAALHVTVT